MLSDVRTIIAEQLGTDLDKVRQMVFLLSHRHHLLPGCPRLQVC